MVYRAVLLVAAVLLIPFAVSNRAIVSVGLWPLPFLIDLPLYLLVLVMLLFGFLAGAATAWAGGRRRRRELRRGRRRVAALEAELKSTRSEMEAKERQELPV